MPSWWAKSSSKDGKKKTSKEGVISVPEQKGIIRSIWSRRRCNDAVSERGSRSHAISRSPSPSPNGLRCQSFADRPTAQPLPLPVLQASSVARSASEISVSRPMLEKRGRPPLTLPLPKPSQTLSKPDVIDVDGNLGTASISSNCSVDSEDAADSRLPSPQGTDFDITGKTISEKTSRVAHGDYTSQMNHVNSREQVKPSNLFYCNPMLSMSPRSLTPNFSQTNILSSRHGNLGSAPDSSMSSPSRSPMRAVTLDPIASSFLWTQRPFADVNFLGSGQCSSPGSGQTSGHNSVSMGGDMGQLWQLNRGSAECSPIPSPRMTSAGPSSRIQSGAVTPIHPRAGGTAPESPTGRIDDGRMTGHRLRLPPVNIANTSPFPTSVSTTNNPPSPIPRSPGRTDSATLTGSRWKKGKMIGRGTFGHVYVGFNSETGEMCAMKEVTLFSDDAKSKESAKHLGQEISLLSRLRHRNIVRYYGSEMIDDKFYIYLEYVSGGSIHKLLQEYGQFGEPVIQNYTCQILSGLAYLHATNTVHRDIKGANILVDPNGRVKLADFGMAKHITGQSTPLSFKGSPYWMAPEVIKNMNGCHLPVDIWSLGCTVLEMATSKPPWSQYEGIAAMFKIGNSKELPPIPDHLSNEAKDFIRLCLQREPSDRPTAAELLRHPFVKNVALAERSVTPLERNIVRPDHVEATGGLAGSHLKDIVHERNATSMDVERLNVLPQVGTKPFKSSSSCHVSCPVSPCGSPLPRSRSPQHINGRMSPSPIASPRMDSGASTPITGGTGAIPYRQPKPYLLEDCEHKSPNYMYVNGSTSDLFRGTLSGLASEGGILNPPFRSPAYAEVHEPYLAACVRQQLLRDKKA